MSTVAGIDLGTTFSLVAAVGLGRPRIIDHQGERLLPSVVGWSPKGELLVGTPALNQYVLEPERTMRSVKRLMGSADEVIVAGQPRTPQQISAFVLRELKQRAERALGEPIQRAVITVPAYFTDAARRATWEAGELAGLDVARIINEPTAAALAYGLDRQDDQKVAVYDLGGGTFDVSIVELNQGVIEVRASHGNLHLGGDDFDELIVNHLADGFEAQHGIDLRRDRRTLARLRRAAEQAKIRLSDSPYTRVTEEFIARKGWRGALHLDVEIARTEFEDLIRPLVLSTLESVDRALRDAGLRVRDLQQVVLVGGSTRIPLVRQVLADHLRKEPRAEVHPDEAVALGAAVQGAIIAGEPIDVVLVDVASHSLGIETMRFVLGHPLPDRYSVLIPRNTTIPCSKADAFYTVTPEQDCARLRVYQGDEEVASRNTLLGEFLFDGISPAGPDEPREVIVSFDYDVNGMVQVSAIDRRSGRTEGISVAATRDSGSVAAGERRAQEAPQSAPSRRMEREINALLRRAERLMTRLRASGQAVLAAQLLGMVGDLERARQRRDYEQARILMDGIAGVLYEHED